MGKTNSLPPSIPRLPIVLCLRLGPGDSPPPMSACLLVVFFFRSCLAAIVLRYHGWRFLVSSRRHIVTADFLDLLWSFLPLFWDGPWTLGVGDVWYMGPLELNTHDQFVLCILSICGFSVMVSDAKTKRRFFEGAGCESCTYLWI